MFLFLILDLSACVTFFYKVVSKVLANRLKYFLSDIISPAQSTFVPRRLISDNIIVAYKALHSMKYRVKGKKEGYMALKLDMSKVYDRIEWCFLEDALSKLGFGEGWIELIMHYVQTVKYSLIINGEQQCHFQPNKGLRQGDPLSPTYSFYAPRYLATYRTKRRKNGSFLVFLLRKGKG